MDATSEALLKGGCLGCRDACPGRDDDLERREIDVRMVGYVGEHREQRRHALEDRDVLAREHGEDIAWRQRLSRAERRARTKCGKQRRDDSAAAEDTIPHTHA